MINLIKLFQIKKSKWKNMIIFNLYILQKGYRNEKTHNKKKNIIEIGY